MSLAIATIPVLVSQYMYEERLNMDFQLDCSLAFSIVLTLCRRLDLEFLIWLNHFKVSNFHVFCALRS